MSFSVKQKKAIKLLGVGVNYRQCCIALGISRDCLWKWRQNPKFMEAVETEKELYLTNYVEDMDALKKKAISKLTDFLDDETISMERRIAVAFDAINCAKTINVNYFK